MTILMIRTLRCRKRFLLRFLSLKNLLLSLGGQCFSLFLSQTLIYTTTTTTLNEIITNPCWRHCLLHRTRILMFLNTNSNNGNTMQYIHIYIYDPGKSTGARTRDGRVNATSLGDESRRTEPLERGRRDYGRKRRRDAASSWARASAGCVTALARLSSTTCSMSEKAGEMAE